MATFFFVCLGLTNRGTALIAVALAVCSATVQGSPVAEVADNGSDDFRLKSYLFVKIKRETQ